MVQKIDPIHHTGDKHFIGVQEEVALQAEDSGSDPCDGTYHLHLNLCYCFRKTLKENLLQGSCSEADPVV